jgi:hypothetical protein
MNAFGEEQPKGNVHGPLALCVSHCNRLWHVVGVVTRRALQFQSAARCASP